MHARRQMIRDAHDRARAVAYEQAGWVAFAFHDPQKMPAFVPLDQATDARETQAAVDDAKVRGWFISMSMRAH